MKCIYYSCYPYEAEDFKVVDAVEYNCDWNGDALDMPYRMYKAAECITEKDLSPKEFVKEVWELLDCPQYKIEGDYQEPFTYEGISVIPTKHLYGATNSLDGIYEINGKYYTMDCFTGCHRYYHWQDAFNACRKSWLARHYLKGIDYNPVLK